jgi:hypothetical protein
MCTSSASRASRDVGCSRAVRLVWRQVALTCAYLSVRGSEGITRQSQPTRRALPQVTYCQLLLSAVISLFNREGVPINGGVTTLA